MPEATFGERLMDARRIKGETIEEVSAQLRIRSSIILAMETSNFSHMPHKGYARNMVSSYARYLGLDSTRITEQFLKEFRRWESTSKRASINNANDFRIPTRRDAGPMDPLLNSERSHGDREMITAARRNQDRTSVWGNENIHETDRAFREQLRQRQDDRGAQQSIATRRTPTRRPGGDTTSTKQLRPNDYVGRSSKRGLFSGASKSNSGRPIMLIVGLVIVFVAMLILWALIANSCSNNESSLNPLSGISASDPGLDENQTSSNLSDIESRIEEDSRYGAFELRIEVSGGACWLQIDVDGSTRFSEVFESGWKETFVVTSSAQIQAGNSNVTVYRNGTEVPVEYSNGVGTWDLRVVPRPIVQNAQTADAQNQRS